MIERSNDPDHRQGNGQGSSEGLGWEAGAKSPGDEDLTYRQADRDQYLLTFEAMHRIGVSIGELWLYYLSMGGNIGEYEIDAYLRGLTHLPALDRDMISQAVNEMIDDICRGPRAPYSAGRSKNTPYLAP
jgi:hypothetical protein